MLLLQGSHTSVAGLPGWQQSSVKVCNEARNKMQLKYISQEPKGADRNMRCAWLISGPENQSSTLAYR